MWAVAGVRVGTRGTGGSVFLTLTRVAAATRGSTLCEECLGPGFLCRLAIQIRVAKNSRGEIGFICSGALRLTQTELGVLQNPISF